MRRLIYLSISEVQGHGAGTGSVLRGVPAQQLAMAGSKPVATSRDIWAAVCWERRRLALRLAPLRRALFSRLLSSGPSNTVSQATMAMKSQGSAPLVCSADIKKPQELPTEHFSSFRLHLLFQQTFGKYSKIISWTRTSISQRPLE